MSKNKEEFDVFKGLNNSQKNTLSSEILLEAVPERCITELVLRVMIKSRGKNIFKEPMLLITNDIITSFPQALAAYKRYLLRFEIELVFRFLKQNLGWTSVAQNFPNQRFYLHSRFIICGVPPIDIFSCGLF